MGGGDLNTKKSWHPNTMKNQERVWKAEQAEANEKRRIDDLRREMDSERSREELTAHGQTSGVLVEKANKKMDWMYKQPHESVDREQYLLGKKIDKTFEKIVSEEKANTSYVKPPPKNHVEHECIPFSIRNLSADVAPNDCQVDMARKLLEDPLVAIRKRELESRAQLLQNPVKLKELTMLLKMDQAETKKKKDKKKSKKHKKGSSDIDKKLAEKLNKLKKVHEKSFDLKGLLQSPSKPVKVKSSKKKKKKKKSSSSSESESEDEVQPKEKHKSRKRSGEACFDRDTSGSKDKRSRYDQNDEENHRKPYTSYNEDRYDRSNEGDHSKSHKSHNQDGYDSKREEEQRKLYRSYNDGRHHEEEQRKSHKSNNDERHLEQRRSHKSNNNERRQEEDQRKSHKSNNDERHREEQRKSHKSSNDECHREEEQRKSHKSYNDGRQSENHKETKSTKSKLEGRSENLARPAIIISQKYNEDSDEDGATPKEKHYGLVRADGSKISSSKAKRQTPPKVFPNKDVKKYEKVRPIKLTEAEKEEKRKEMMNNANERDKEREQYVSNYRDLEKKQEAMEKKHKFKDDFVEKHLREAAKFTSVESRIKSNIYNIQRSNRHMDTNFAKR